MQTLEKRTSEQVRYDIDCTLLLAPGEVVVGTPSVTADANAGTALAFGTPAANTAPAVYTDQFGSTRTAPIGQVIQVEIDGGSIPARRRTLDYIIRAKFATNINPLVEATVRLRLNDTP